MTSEFLSVKEVAVIFGVNEVTIRNAIKKGYIVAIKIGNKPKSPYRISKKSINLIHESIIKKMVKNSQN